MLQLPFDPINRAQEIERAVIKGNKRQYFRFRYAPFYGGAATADAIGCNLLCAYCWNYRHNKDLSQGELYSPSEVASSLQAIAKKHRCSSFRISGCEPILGKASMRHLVSVIKATHHSNFIIETNGIILGHQPELIKMLEGINAQVRISIKAHDAAGFERITGARGEAFTYQINAVKELKAHRVKGNVAIMTEFVDKTALRRLLPLSASIEVEAFTRYPGTLSRLKERGIPMP